MLDLVQQEERSIGWWRAVSGKGFVAELGEGLVVCVSADAEEVEEHEEAVGGA